MQGKAIRVPAPASSSSGGGGTGFDLPSSPAGFEGFTRSRARRSSIVSASSITSEPSFDRDVDFGIAVSITLQVERMLQVGLFPLTPAHPPWADAGCVVPDPVAWCR